MDSPSDKVYPQWTDNVNLEAVQNLEIEKCIDDESVQVFQSENVDEVIDSILKKYHTHPSILKIKENVQVEEKFKFVDTTEDEIYKKIKSLNPKKACMENDIPAKILIGTNDVISEHL